MLQAGALPARREQPPLTLPAVGSSTWPELLDHRLKKKSWTVTKSPKLKRKSPQSPVDLSCFKDCPLALDKAFRDLTVPTRA